MYPSSATMRDVRSAPSPKLGGRLYWSLRREAEALVQLESAGQGVTIAILDGALDRGHPAFAQADLKPGFFTSARSGGAAIQHGTAVASLILGRGPSGGGLAPKATGLPITIYGGDGNVGVLPCSQDDLATALEAALAASAEIINISGGGFDASGAPSPRLASVLAACARAGVAVIAAAGNDGCACPHVPAASPGVLAIGALSDDGHPLASSNWGDAYRGHSLAAPGARLPAAEAFGGWAEYAGTSYATALASGLAAKLLSGARRRRPDLRGADVIEALLRTARPPEGAWSVQHLGGTLDPRAALDWLNTPRRPASGSVRPTGGPGEAAMAAAALSPSGEGCADSERVYAVAALAVARSENAEGSVAELMRAAPSPAVRAAIQEGRIHEPGWTWSLNSGGRPILILQPDGAFARENTDWLAAAIQRQWAGEACRIAVAGWISGVHRKTGLPILRPERLGLAAWPRASQPLARMTRGAGRTGVDRALNFALTRLASEKPVSALQPASATVLPSALGRPQSHETAVAFFDPLHRLSAGRKIWRATVDVSDVLPVIVDGPHEYWTS
ncbi:MAG: hypothetical protein DI526_09465 [Caulobacter segnis]|uniref:Peptidase S8 and S53 subtilisin kexin sedolisin n=1 Tax=Caulobacter segnis TaxID=88688 RepID=A0A2W5XBT0_9CAUL|nr:MAG: hypothetical protein DI526_09465 [Caulobacter segnis]